MSRNKNTIWSDSLLEDSLCSGISQFSSISNTDELIHVSGRDIESYQYSASQTTQKNAKIKNHLRSPAAREGMDAKKEIPREDVKKRLGALVAFDENKSRSRIHVTEIDTEENVAKEIARYLNEEKIELISRCVKVLGRKKALEILYATEDIQDNGGMLTSDGNRTRTPGGVYIQLVRKDDTILNCQRKQIFIEDAIKKKKQKALKRLAQTKRFNKAKEELLKKKKAGLNKEYDDKQETTQNEEEDLLDGIEEDGMIYFYD